MLQIYKGYPYLSDYTRKNFIDPTDSINISLLITFNDKHLVLKKSYLYLLCNQKQIK
jgi:hypothetical protein